jgi:hypothetical protein
MHSVAQNRTLITPQKYLLCFFMSESSQKSLGTVPQRSPKKKLTSSTSFPFDSDARWTPNSESRVCMLCDCAFTLVKRRHHCRRCGLLVCNACSLRRVVTNGMTIPQRICDKCVTEIATDPQACSKNEIREPSKKGSPSLADCCF